LLEASRSHDDEQLQVCDQMRWGEQQLVCSIYPGFFFAENGCGFSYTIYMHTYQISPFQQMVIPNMYQNCGSSLVAILFLPGFLNRLFTNRSEANTWHSNMNYDCRLNEYHRWVKQNEYWLRTNVGFNLCNMLANSCPCQLIEFTEITAVRK
jgi:hypothetical protein